MMRLALGFPISPVHSSTAIARTLGPFFLALSTWPGYCAQAGAANASSSARLLAALVIME
jgi:hypothetical protein